MSGTDIPPRSSSSLQKDSKEQGKRFEPYFNINKQDFLLLIKNCKNITLKALVAHPQATVVESQVFAIHIDYQCSPGDT
jgi:hypothetical protein